MIKKKFSVIIELFVQLLYVGIKFIPWQISIRSDSTLIATLNRFQKKRPVNQFPEYIEYFIEL